MASYTEALMGVQSGLSWLGWLHVGLSCVQTGVLVAGWVWLRDEVRERRREHADLTREIRHPSLDARALSEAQVSVDDAVREIRDVAAEIRQVGDVARAVAEAQGIEVVTAAGHASGGRVGR